MPIYKNPLAKGHLEWALRGVFEILNEKFKNKKISIIGINDTGVSAALMVKSLGGTVFISDKKDKSELKEKMTILESNSIPYETGGNTEKIIENADLIIRSFGCSG